MQQTTVSGSNSKKTITLLVVIAMSFMATLDSSIVNSVLPVMSKKMNVTLSSIEWVIASYSIIICCTLLFFGRLGDIIGKSRVFQCGTVVFTVASLLCGLCHTLPMLIACRFIQGIGASAYMANNQGIVTELFPNGGRGKALGLLGTAVALGTMIGPPAGGFIVSVLDWNYIFLLNVPIGILVFLLGLKHLPKGTKSNEQMDKAGAILQFFGTVLLFTVLIQAQKVGFENPYILSGVLLSVVLIALFIRLEKRHPQPLLELRIFQNKIFSLSLICGLISFICIQSSVILLPFYLQDTLKFTPSQAGLFLMISPMVMAVLSPAFGTLSDKIGSEVITLVGLLFMSAGFLFLSTMNEHSLLAVCAVYVSVLAVGQSLFQPANNSLIMSSCPKNKLGIAGSVNSFVRNLGLSVGIIFSTTLLYSFMSQKMNYRVSDYVTGRDDVFVYGMSRVYLILVVVCCAGAALTAFRMYQSKKILKSAPQAAVSPDADQ